MTPWVDRTLRSNYDLPSVIYLLRLCRYVVLDLGKCTTELFPARSCRPLVLHKVLSSMSGRLCLVKLSLTLANL